MCTISRAAALTGLPASALRYYDRLGLVSPARTESGYRAYDRRGLEALRTVVRGKRLGLSLGQIRELIGLLNREACEPVQEHLRDLVAEKIAETDRLIDDLRLFRAALSDAVGALRASTPDGPCDATCGCLALS